MELQLNTHLSHSINSTFKQEHYNLLYSIYIKYGKIGNFSFKDLLIKFPFKDINIYQSNSHKPTQNKKKIIINRKKNKLPTQNHRCMARCWGQGPYKVSFDKTTNIWSVGTYVTFNPTTNQWTYGTQCKKHRKESQYCYTHLKQFNNFEYSKLTHGRIDQEPPHQHYDKYKRQIMIAKAVYESNST